MSRFQPERWIFFPISSLTNFEPELTKKLTNIIVREKNGSYYIGDYTIFFKAAWERLGFVYLGLQLVNDLIENRETIKHEKFGTRIRYHTYNTILNVKSCLDLLSLILRDYYKLRVSNPNTDLTKENFRGSLHAKIKNREIWNRISDASSWLDEVNYVRKMIAHRTALPMPFYRGEPPLQENPYMFTDIFQWTEFFRILTVSGKLRGIPVQEFLKNESEKLWILFKTVMEDFLLNFQEGNVTVKNTTLIPKVIINFQGAGSDVFKIRVSRVK